MKFNIKVVLLLVFAISSALAYVIPNQSEENKGEIQRLYRRINYSEINRLLDKSIEDVKSVIELKMNDHMELDFFKVGVDRQITDDLNKTLSEANTRIISIKANLIAQMANNKKVNKTTQKKLNTLERLTKEANDRIYKYKVKSKTL
ncbi:hypothetical protein BCR32DRAFT_280974 [Anaeromyces robustus]|uniref:Uncharacterized protein n=1 Tax=Anaeromyces robustus TaxID=1754192 RepID=A0A1Y1X289_9FUNG|nr:hypothetical protein BCR32DRAFT_280974 [Anaeromyces robustus]|eukprot:ORX79919.1 hypothetical protein BCR32DRAFT_280974 [Anaeromyces robustus]